MRDNGEVLILEREFETDIEEERKNEKRRKWRMRSRR